MDYIYTITTEGHVEVEHGEIKSDKNYNDVYNSLLKDAWEKHGECFLGLRYKTELPRYKGRNFQQLV